MNWLRQNNQLIIRLAGSLLAIVLLGMLLRGENGAEFLSALQRISFSYFLLAILSLFVSRVCTAWRWHVLLKSADIQISFLQTMRLTFMGLFASNFLPTTIGGDVARLGAAIQLGYDRAIILASLVVDRLVGMAGMIFTLPFGIGPALAIKSAGLQSFALTSFYQKITRFIKNTLSAFQIWLKKPYALFSSLMATFGNMAFIFLTIYILIIGLDRFVSYWLIAGIWGLTYFVTLIPISINGFGLQELSVTFLLVEVGGLTHAESLTIAVLIRAVFLITSLPGAFSFPTFSDITKQNINN
ncbi:MAG: hypothetical protein UZ14_CFX002001850 [Chloroflexi bacterium OLB14]|nr:MAG: hypothetical protein UZ14_CFX002001850 [Chloroflexi bacterium OLB14]